MKIAVTSTGKDLESPMDPRFGRAAYILIVDTDTLDVEVLDNTENVNAFKGAGIQAATMICDKKAEVLLRVLRSQCIQSPGCRADKGWR